MTAIYITIRPEDAPQGFECFLSKFMARYYSSVQISFGDKEGIVLDDEPSTTDTQTAWMLLDAAGAEYYQRHLQAA